VLNNKKISVIIPTYNEEKSLPKVLNDIPKDIVDDIIVVDNRSTDRSAAIAASHGARVIKENKRGYGNACLKGLQALKATDIVVILDADYSDYPDKMKNLLRPIANNEADFVLGSRVLGRREQGAIPPIALWGNKLTTFLIKIFTGFTFTDMSPFRAIKYESILKLKMTDPNYGWNVEMQMKAVEHKLKIKEIPADYRCRIGKSKISGSLIGGTKAGIKIIYAVFKYAFFNKPNQ